MYLLLILTMSAVGVCYLVWWRSPMEAVNAEMAERVVTTRATLDELADAHPLVPRRRLCKSG